MRFWVKRDPVLCGSLNGDIWQFVGLNFGKQILVFVCFPFIYVLFILTIEFIRVIVFIWPDLRVCSLLVVTNCIGYLDLLFDKFVFK